MNKTLRSYIIEFWIIGAICFVSWVIFGSIWNGLIAYGVVWVLAQSLRLVLWGIS